MIELQIEGLDRVKAEIKRIGKEAEQGVANAVKATALEVISDVKKRIQRGPKSGRTYTRGNVSHTASAPGQAPATDTGTLASSTYFTQSGKLSAVVGSRLAYASYLEFGTTRIKPRPSWTPAVEAAAPKLQKRIETAIRKAAK
jgi:HK97 gp10 family phage protein